MKLRDVMTPDVEIISPNNTVFEAATKMRELDVGVLPVCDGDRLRGMITDRDIVVHGLANRRNPDQAKVSDVMTKGVIYCYEDEDVRDAINLMREHQIRRLIILDRNKRLCGIVSLGDIAIESGGGRIAGKAIADISEPIHHPMMNRIFMRRALGLPISGLSLLALAGGLYYWGNRSPEMRSRFYDLRDRWNRRRAA